MHVKPRLSILRIRVGSLLLPWRLYNIITTTRYFIALPRSSVDQKEREKTERFLRDRFFIRGACVLHYTVCTGTEKKHFAKRKNENKWTETEQRAEKAKQNKNNRYYIVCYRVKLARE